MELATQKDLVVLVVDDQELHAKRYAEAAKRHLERYNERADIACVCTEDELERAPETLRHYERVYVLTDMTLEGWTIAGRGADGFVVLDFLLERVPRAKIVIYSAVQDLEDSKQQALEMGAYDLVSNSDIEQTESGLLHVLASFATIERRLREASARPRPSEEIDPLAQLLLKVNIGLCIVGQYGHIWFQNEYNRNINKADANAVGRCHRLLHGWKCIKGECPWCPTLHAVRTQQSVRRALILPVRNSPKGGGYSLKCVEMATEPLMSRYGEGTAQVSRAAGAVESVLLRQAEWEQKKAIQQIVDLMIMIAGLAADASRPVRINVYEVAGSHLTCRIVSSCVVKNVDAPLLECDVCLEIRCDAPSWNSDERIIEPGPASAVRVIETKEQSWPIDVQFDETKRCFFFGEKVDLASLHEVRGLEVHTRHCERIFYPPEKPTVVVEIVRKNDDSFLFLENGWGNYPDLELYVDALAKATERLRQERAEIQSCPDSLSFADCKSREGVWNAVQGSLDRLSVELKSPRSNLWWHYRKLTREKTISGHTKYFLDFDHDATRVSRSPYAEIGQRIPSVARVEIPPPEEWTEERRRYIPDQDSFEGTGELDPRGFHTGSYLTRVRNKPRFSHQRPEKAKEQGFQAVIAGVQTGEESHRQRLDSIRAYADFPIGDDLAPLGTLHIQSEHNDLFASRKVQKYLTSIAFEVNRVLSRILSDEENMKTRELTAELERLDILSTEIEARFADMNQWFREIETWLDAFMRPIASDEQAVTATTQEIKRRLVPLQAKLRTMQYLHSLKSGKKGAEPRTECGLELLLRRCETAANAEIEADPLWGDRKKPTVKITFEGAVKDKVNANSELLGAGMLQLAMWAALNLRADDSYGAELTPEIELKAVGNEVEPTIEISFPTRCGAELLRSHKAVFDWDGADVTVLHTELFKKVDRNPEKRVVSLALSRLMIGESVGASMWKAANDTERISVAIPLFGKGEGV